MKTDEELKKFFQDLTGEELVVAYQKIGELFSDLYKEIRDKL